MSIFDQPSSTIQFLIPKPVQDALHERREQLRARAIRGGVLPEHARYEYSVHRLHPSQVHITCKRPMAAAIVEEIVAISSTARGDLVFQCAAAVQSGLKALEPTKSSGHPHPANPEHTSKPS